MGPHGSLETMASGKGFVVVGLIGLVSAKKNTTAGSWEGNLLCGIRCFDLRLSLSLLKKNIEMAKDRDECLTWKVTKIFQNLGKRDQ